MQPIRTGIYGGSFNPIHNGHLAVAREIRRRAALDEVWLMVSPQNPLKQVSDLLPDEQRLDMTRRAVEGEEGLVACDFEFHLPRPSYTWHTLTALSRDFPNREFVLLIGADNWAVFDRWYRGEDIVRQYEVVIYPREGSPVDAGALPENVRLVETPLHDVSSTQVRQLIREGRDISQLVPESIRAMAEQFYRH